MSSLQTIESTFEKIKPYINKEINNKLIKMIIKN